jgi:hypothetical protein
VRSAHYGDWVLGRRDHSKPPEDPSVASVEAILDEAGTRITVTRTDPAHENRPQASNALHICACVTPEDAPTWLIYENTERGLMWGRTPGGVEAADVIDARFIAGGHADPGQVLAWLRGAEPNPWGGGGYGWGDDHVADALLRNIRRP